MYRTASSVLVGLRVYCRAFTRIGRNQSLCTRALVCLLLYMHHYADKALSYEDTVLQPTPPAAIDDSAATEAS